MEKYARAEIANGTKNPDELEVSTESDIYRVLNLHYNRNNHIEVTFLMNYIDTGEIRILSLISVKSERRTPLVIMIQFFFHPAGTAEF